MVIKQKKADDVVGASSGGCGLESPSEEREGGVWSGVETLSGIC